MDPSSQSDDSQVPPVAQQEPLHSSSARHCSPSRVLPLPQAINLHDKKVNTLHLEPAGERELASSCSDGSLAVWDVRKLTSAAGGVVQPVATARHSFTCQSAYFAPNGAQPVTPLRVC